MIAHVPFCNLSTIYQLNKEFQKLIVVIKTILVANDRKPSDSCWSKYVVVSHRSQGQASLLTFFTLMSLFFYLISLFLTPSAGLLCLHGKKTWQSTGPTWPFHLKLQSPGKRWTLLISVTKSWQRTWNGPAWIKCSLWNQSAC